jgi:hypothetical protein
VHAPAPLQRCLLLTISRAPDVEGDALADAAGDALPLGGGLTDGEALPAPDAVPAPLGVWRLGVDVNETGAALPEALLPPLLPPLEAEAAAAADAAAMSMALLLVAHGETPGCCVAAVAVVKPRLALPLDARAGGLGLAGAAAAVPLAAAGCTSAGAPRRLTTVPPPRAPTCGSAKPPVCSGGLTPTSIKSPTTTPRPASPPAPLPVRADVRNRIRLVLPSGTAIVAGSASPRHSAVPRRTPVSSLLRAVDHTESVGAPSCTPPVLDPTGEMRAHTTRAPSSANARLSAAAQPM